MALLSKPSMVGVMLSALGLEVAGLVGLVGVAGLVGFAGFTGSAGADIPRLSESLPRLTQPVTATRARVQLTRWI
jgi:hypothetical protein